MTSRGRALTLALTAVAITLGVFAALRASWLSDDAFISFRYARHLVQGLGLVYNAGERVEGYSNFLWTVWLALGMRVGVAPEAWSNAWGVACFAAAIALLGLHRANVDSARAARRPDSGQPRRRATAVAFTLPLAALGGALHPDWARFATSGLETSLFTLLLVLAWVLLARVPLGPRAAGGAGLALALAALTRPEGVMFAVPGVAYVAWRARQRAAALLAFVGVFVAAWAPYVAWKIAYYGDYLPNTYYAKSADLAWWSQGWIYARLFFRHSPLLALAIPLAAFAAWGGTSRGARHVAGSPEKPDRARIDSAAIASATTLDPADVRGPIALAAAFALGLTLFVLRVGGDFMFARLLVPAIPFYLLLLEYGVARLTRGRPWVAWAACAAALASFVLVPYPLAPKETLSGIVREWEFYPASTLATTQREGATLHRYFAGLPVGVAFVGGQAGLMYYADPPVAIEAQTGLTDARIAHETLTQRGRVGHEKLAPLAYLLEARRVNLVIKHYAGVALALDDSLPAVMVGFDDVPGRVVCWDDSLFAEFRRRGARVVDFRAAVDELLPQLAAASDAEAEQAAARMRRFWFERVPDPELRARVVAVLERTHPSAVAFLGP